MHLDLFEQMYIFICQAPHRLKNQLGETLEEVLISFQMPDIKEAALAIRVLQEEIERINTGTSEYLAPTPSHDQRPLALILISQSDHQETLYTKASTYAQLAKISLLSAHFRCVCRQIDTLDLGYELELLQKQHPDREVGYIHVISHGFNGDLWPDAADEDGLQLHGVNSAHLHVTFESCTTGQDDIDCLARRFAELNPGVLTFAPKESVLHCVPLVSSHNGHPHVSAVLHLATSEWPRNAIEQLIKSFLKGDSPQMSYELMPSFQSA